MKFVPSFCWGKADVSGGKRATLPHVYLKGCQTKNGRITIDGGDRRRVATSPATETSSCSIQNSPARSSSAELPGATGHQQEPSTNQRHRVRCVTIVTWIVKRPRPLRMFRICLSCSAELQCEEFWPQWKGQFTAVKLTK